MLGWSSMRGFDESPVPGRFLLFALVEGPVVVKRKGGVGGLLGDALDVEGGDCHTLVEDMLGEDETGARV